MENGFLAILLFPVAHQSLIFGDEQPESNDGGIRHIGERSVTILAR